MRDRRRIVRRFSGFQWQPYKFFTLLTLGSIVPLLLPSAASAVSCDAVVGKWAWFTGGDVTINADGTFTQKSGNSGTWKCTDASKGAVALKWKQGGYLNRLALADGGTRLVSTDPSQSFVKATRINQEQALADVLTRQDRVSSPSSSRRPSGQPGGTVPIKPSTPLASTQKMGPAPFASPQGFVNSDPKVEARFKQGYDLFTMKNYAAAFPILVEVAQAGHPRAQALLGRTYQEGLGQAKDYKQAAEWYGKAAAQGHRAALFSLGNLYFEGDGVAKDQVKAIQLYRQSADKGYDQAEFILGLSYEFGWGGLPRDRRTAIKWLDRAGRHKNGGAGFIATWLEKPDTPHFKDEVQLGKYIGANIERRAAAAFGGGGSDGGGGNPCSSYSGPAAAACNQGDKGAIDRYREHQETQEDKRKYGVQ
ncbi:MAG TPA: tetratricopeptide repeat protein [Nitrospira sp.]|nr:tetratricopeptide repeat protein [Nitrospira sp.]